MSPNNVSSAHRLCLSGTNVSGTNVHTRVKFLLLGILNLVSKLPCRKRMSMHGEREGERKRLARTKTARATSTRTHASGP